MYKKMTNNTVNSNEQNYSSSSQRKEKREKDVDVVLFYTQLDGLLGFFTSHNCEIVMSH